MEQIKISSPDHPARNTIQGLFFCPIIVLSVKVGQQPNGVPTQGHDLAAIEAGYAHAKGDSLAESIFDAAKRFAGNGIQSNFAYSGRGRIEQVPRSVLHKFRKFVRRSLSLANFQAVFGNLTGEEAVPRKNGRIAQLPMTTACSRGFSLVKESI